MKGWPSLPNSVIPMAHDACADEGVGGHVGQQDRHADGGYLVGQSIVMVSLLTKGLGQDAPPAAMDTAHARGLVVVTTCLEQFHRAGL
jgi:hypothetical protein